MADHDQKHFLEGKTIIVAGGGIAGTAFVIGIRRLWDPALRPPTIHIYDGEPEDAAARREGYSLSLAGYDASGGLLALRRLGLLDDILPRAVSGVDGSGAFKIWGPDWREYVSFRREPVDGLPSASIRVARKDLLSTLHEGLDRSGLGDSIQWATRCVSVERIQDGRLRVQLARGPGGSDMMEQECDVLIAADGANSKIRQCLRPDDKLDFAGAVLRAGVSRFEDALPKPLEEDWGFILSGTGISCFFSPVDKHSLIWGVGHLEDHQVSTLDLDSAEDVQAVIQKARDLGSGLQEPFQTVVAHTDPKTVMCLNARDKLPFPHDGIDQLPVIFIGDANHAVSPFAGYGANLALSDAWDLAQQLCMDRSLEESISAYDRLAVPRATKILKGSRARLKAGHSTGIRYWMFWLVLMLGRFVSWIRRRR